MKIGLLMYANDFPYRGGIWRYSYNLARNFIELDKENKYAFIHGQKTPENFVDLEQNEKILPMNSFKKILKLPAVLADDNFNVIHETANFTPLFSKEKYKKIVTIHDLTALIYPQTTGIKGYLFFKFYLPRALKRVDSIIVPTENTKKDIQKFYNLPPEKIKVIAHGIEEKFFRKVDEKEIQNFRIKNKLNFPFLLWVGAINPHKNLVTIFKAFKALPTDFQKKYKIILAGYLGDKPNDTLRYIKQSGLEDKVVRFGSVNENELVLLYKSADLFIFPSLYEGFGFPVLEAMAAGCPVISSNIAPLSEIINDAGILISPTDISLWREKLIEIFDSDDIKAELRLKGQRRARQFSWKRCAQEHLNVYLQ